MCSATARWTQGNCEPDALRQPAPPATALHAPAGTVRGIAGILDAVEPHGSRAAPIALLALLVVLLAVAAVLLWA